MGRGCGLSPTSWRGRSSATIARSVIIRFIESGAVLGDRVVVKNNSLIWHGVRIGDDVFIGPNTVFTNVLAPRARYQTYREDWEKTDVADRATIGANSTIVSGIRLGYNCMIGAGSVVTKDVPDHALVLGNPARQVGWVCDCGRNSAKPWSARIARSTTRLRCGAGGAP